MCLNLISVRHLLLCLILLWSYQNIRAGAISPFKKDRLERFFNLLESSPVDEVGHYYELGLHSDHPLIYIHCLDWAVHNTSLSTLPILEQRLTTGNLGPEAKRLTHMGIFRLRYYHTNENLRLTFLKEILQKEDPKVYPELFEWVLDQFSDLGSADDLSLLQKLEGISSLKQALYFARKRLLTKSYSRDSLQAYILLYQSEFREMRNWALQRLSHFNDPRAARFLTRLYQEASLNYSLRELKKIKESYQAHQKRFPTLHP